MLNKIFIAVIINAALILTGTPVFAWTIQQSFDDQSLGQTCGNWGSAGRSKVTNEASSSSPNACHLEIHTTDGPSNDPGTGFGQWGGVIPHPVNLKKGDEIWVRVRTFMPVGFDYNSYSNGQRLKFLRVHTMSPGGDNHGYLDWYINPYPRLAGSSWSFPFVYLYEGNARMYGAGTDPEDTIKLGTWETYEFYISLDNISARDGGKGQVRLWKNGKQILSMREQTLKTADTISNATFIFTYWNGGTPKNQFMFVDDVVITTETPAGRDAQGNPYIGVGDIAAKPLPPTLN